MKIKMIFVCLVSLFLFTACNRFLVPPLWENKDDTNLVLHFSATDLRTVLPDIIPHIYEYRILCTGPEVEPPVNTTDSSFELFLAVGIWNIEVEALNDASEVIAYGSIENIEIIPGSVINKTVTLSPLQNGEHFGSIDISIVWPAAQIIDETSTVMIDNHLYEIGSSYPGITLGIVDTTMTFQVTDINSGNYEFFAYLNLENNMQTTVSESIQVFDNLTSSAIIELLTDDFTQVPPPTVITSSTAENNQIILTWENTSPIVTHYSIERSESEHSGYLIIGVTDGQTLSFSDPDVDLMTTYYYRIIASSTGGNSEPSENVAISVAPPVPGNGGVIIFSGTSNTTTNLIWWKASDNLSAPDTLMYKIVSSDSADIDTISNIENNGLVVQNWTSDIDTVTATGLNSGTTYYFNILVKDEAGNVQLYSMNSETPSSIGELEFTIIVIEPEDEPITFSEDDDISVPQNSSLILSINEGFDSYKWYLDGIIVDDQIESIFEYDCSGIPLGVHHLTVFVTLNEMLYSKTLRFTIQN